MRSNLTLPIISFQVLIWLVTFGVKAESLKPENDTLLLQTEKHTGYGIFGCFGRMLWPISIQEISDTNELIDKIPFGISNPKLATEFIDMKVLAYKNMRKSNSANLHAFINENHPLKIDTAKIPSLDENTLRMIVGMKGLDSIYIVDENGNNDFRDDSIRMLRRMNHDAVAPEPAKCHYWIYDGREMVRDSSWIVLERDRSNIIRISVSHHLMSTFSVDGQQYEIQCINGPPSVRFCFDNPNIAVTSHNGVEKDSILYGEIVTIGEYVQLGESHYKIVEMENDGSEILLVKQEDVSDKISDQVGFLAPDFRCITTQGDSISLGDYRDKYLLLVNVTACYSPIMSYESYKELSGMYDDKIEILAIDHSPAVLQVNIDNLGLKGKFIIAPKNRSIADNYREDFCSRTCFLIGPSGHVEDKFEIGEWKSSLARHFKY